MDIYEIIKEAVEDGPPQTLEAFATWAAKEGTTIPWPPSNYGDALMQLIKQALDEKQSYKQIARRLYPGADTERKLKRVAGTVSKQVREYFKIETKTSKPKATKEQIWDTLRATDSLNKTAHQLGMKRDDLLSRIKALAKQDDINQLLRKDVPPVVPDDIRDILARIGSIGKIEIPQIELSPEQQEIVASKVDTIQKIKNNIPQLLELLGQMKQTVLRQPTGNLRPDQVAKLQAVAKRFELAHGYVRRCLEELP